MSTQREAAEVERKEAVSFIPPELEEIMLLDVKEENVREDIARELAVEYLGEASTVEPLWAVSGVLWGSNHRLFVNLAVKYKQGTAKNVIFLVDTSSPHTFLCPSAMNAILPSGSNLPSKINGNIQDAVYSINLSPPNSHFSDINILGMDFLVAQRLILTVNTPQRSSKISQ